MIYQCWNEGCPNQLVKNSPSWFCSDACKIAYWGEAYDLVDKSSKDYLQQKLAILKARAPKHIETAEELMEEVFAS